MDSPAEAAKILSIHWALNLGGAVLANPITPEYEVEAAVIKTATQQALAEAHVNGISGKALIPFLLRRIAEISGGLTSRWRSTMPNWQQKWP